MSTITFFFPESSGLVPVSVSLDGYAVPRKGEFCYFSTWEAIPKTPGYEYQEMGRKWRVRQVDYSIRVYADSPKEHRFSVEIHLSESK